MLQIIVSLTAHQHNSKYDIVASKFMTGIENHNKRNRPVSLNNDLGLIGVLVQIVIALLAMVEVVLNWIWKRL